MTRLRVTFCLISLLASCREGRDASVAMPDEEQDDAGGAISQQDASVAAMEAGSSDRDGESSADVTDSVEAGGSSPSDARADSAGSSSDASVAEAGTADASAAQDAGRGRDAGSGGSCVSLTRNNAQGVGDGCTHTARELACPTTRTCLESLVVQGLVASEPYFCTKDCAQDAECGEGARCCKPHSWANKICVLDSCRALCE